MYTIFMLLLQLKNMQLKKIFGSGARVKLFRQFLMHPDEEYYIRELTRILGEQINSLRRELDNLEKIGMLKSREKNRRKFYRINPHFSLLPEFTSIIQKTNTEHDRISKDITRMGDVQLIMLTGSMIGGDNALDILIVGEIQEDMISQYAANVLKKPDLNYAVLSKEDFLYRITIKDKFVLDLFSDRKNLILKNKLKKDTELLISALK